MSQRTTVNLNLQSASAKQEVASVFQITGLLLTSPQITTLSLQLAPNEVRDLTESLSKLITPPASPSDPDVPLQFIAVKSEAGFDISLRKTAGIDQYTGVSSTLYFQTFRPEGERLNHVKIRAAALATAVYLIIGHGVLAP